MKNITYLLILLCINLTAAQETVGLIYEDVALNTSEGYTLFTSLSDDRVFLMNNCGEVVNQWDFSGKNSRQVYLLENGNLLQGNGFNADLRDWNNNILWSLDYMAVLGVRMHHDIEPLPNGNFLVLIRDPYTNTEMFEQGMDTSYPEDTLVLERIIEIQPVGTDSATIVWEWKLFDHLVQDFDSSKPNFGIVADNPQRLNVNYEDGHGSNPIHANAIDYNEDLDQIAISSRHLSEVLIIDHSTTTVEASSNSGGIYGKGGDFLWRWGNPEVYNKGTFADRKIGSQHDIKWIPDGPHQGKLSVFSNDGYGSDQTASSIHIIDPNDNNGVYSMNSGKFLPDDYFWSYDGTILGEVMVGSSRCGMQIMSNGNALINETDKGRLSEVDGAGNVVWVYIIPTAANSTFNQFETPLGTGSFRAHRFPENYPGLDGVTFNNTGIIEDVNAISTDCANRLSVDDSFLNSLSVYPNPTRDILNFKFDKAIDQVEVYDLSGKVVLTKKEAEFINMESLTNGLYLIKISVEGNSQFMKIMKH